MSYQLLNEEKRIRQNNFWKTLICRFRHFSHPWQHYNNIECLTAFKMTLSKDIFWYFVNIKIGSQLGHKALVLFSRELTEKKQSQYVFNMALIFRSKKRYTIRTYSFFSMANLFFLKWAKPSLFLVYFRSFYKTNRAQIWLEMIKALMVCLGLKPWVAIW